MRNKEVPEKIAFRAKQHVPDASANFAAGPGFLYSK